MYLTFRSKNPHNTLFLQIELDSNENNHTEKDLIELGWCKERHRTLLNNSRIEIWGKKGTGLFGGWTEEEKKQNMASVRKLLRKYGYQGIKHVKLTTQDLL